jgi:hypothetical protein
MDQVFAKGDGQTIIFEGLNTYLAPGFDIKDGELTYVRNMDCHKSPLVLSTRPGKVQYGTAITTPNALGVRDNAYLHALDGTMWKRWDGSAWQNVQTGLTNASGKIFDFKAAASVLTVLINGTDKRYWNGSSVTNMTNAPASKLCVPHQYRLYFATDNAIQASDLSDLNTYPNNCIMPITAATGPLLAINRFGDHVIAWAENSMHKLFGIEPYDWTIIDIIGVGCISDRSVIEHLNYLWWLGPKGTAYKYGGGRPQLISDRITNEYLQSINDAYKHLCAAGAIGNSIFWSIPHGTSTVNNLILEYRVDLDRWYVHTGNIVQFAKIGNTLYGLANDGKIYNMQSGTTDAGTAIAFSAITKPFHDMAIHAKKTVKQMYLVVNLPSGSTLTISGSKSEAGSDFTTIKTISAASSLQDLQILIPTNILQLANWYRLKFEGTGPCDIYYLYKEVGKRGAF